MAAVQLVDFKDIYEAVMEELKIPTSDTTTLARVKRNINMIYINEVIQFKRWPWLIKRKDITHEKYYNSGASDTADVTQDSTTVTLSAPVPAGKGSLAGQFFATDGDSEIYTIDSHVAGSDTLELTVVFNGETNATASFKIWTDKVDLPTDARETIGVRHDYNSRDLIPRGVQKLDELAQQQRRREDRPRYYSTDDYFDPSSGDPETESDRFRRFRIWPAVYKENTTLHVDYIQEVAALDADGDEPNLPLEDRVVLVYGALRQSWVRDRNPETATLNSQLYRDKLSKMAGKIEDALDMPRMEADDNYMSSKRTSNSRSYNT